MATLAVEPVPQHLLALRRGNQVRLNAATVKHEVRMGTVTLAGALEDPRAGVLPVTELLRCLRGYGRERSVRVVRRLMISELKRVRDLTARQRKALIDECDPPIIVLSDGQLRVLSYLAGMDSPVRVTVLAVRLNENGRALSAMLRRLRALGLVDGVACPDRHVWWITDHGRVRAGVG